MKALLCALLSVILLNGRLFATPALEALVTRVTPRLQGKVSFQVRPEADSITVAAHAGKLSISAPDVNQLAAGYGIYLRDVARLHWSWCHNRLDVPSPQPLPEKPIEAQIPWKWRQAYNYCTLSYTMAFWDIPQWEEELDRLALSGINMPLVQAGLEKVWQLTLREIGYPEEKIFAFIPNPSSAAWWNMGNLEGYNGPLTQAEIDNEARLGKFIVTRARELGMQPILQGFMGLVPHDLGDYVNVETGYPDARYVPQGYWYNAKEYPRPAVLDPTTATFRRLAEVWYKNLESVYGKIPDANPFGGDLFHEGGSTKGLDVSACGAAVAGAMQQATPGAVWVIQSWVGNPSPALLKDLNPENTLILLLRKIMRDAYSPRDFGDIPWIWCELLNFGGRTGLFGNLNIPAELGKLQQHPSAATLQGISLISEGFETNPAFYDLFLRRIVMPKDVIIQGKDFDALLNDYLRCRYGFSTPELVDGLKLLNDGVFSPPTLQDGARESLFGASPAPGVHKASHWGNSSFYYDPESIRTVFNTYLVIAKTIPESEWPATFRFDILDLARQLLADYDRRLLNRITETLYSQDTRMYEKGTSLFLETIRALDEILRHEPIYTLDRQRAFARAKAGGLPEREKAWERALRRFYTTWAEHPGILNDYSGRHYAGLFKQYYLRRWQIFFHACRRGLKNPEILDDCFAAAKNGVQDFEIHWEDPSQFPLPPPVVTPAPSPLLSKLTQTLVFCNQIHTFLAAGEGPQRMTWRLKNVPGNMPQEFSFTVTLLIEAPGSYTACFLWNTGHHALEIENAAFYKGETEIVRDEHTGQTGFVHRNNCYTLNVPESASGIPGDYTLRARVKGVGGQDSAGILLLVRQTSR